MSEHNGKDTYDYVLKGARVIDPYNQIDGMLDLAVSNNKIAGIGENLGGAKETHDVTGKIVVPGMIDTDDGNPLTIGLICICTGKEASLAAKNKSTLVQYIPLGSSIKNDCAIGCLFT